MDLYDAFKYIIEKNDIKILDDASKCEWLLKEQGVSGEDLNARLFITVLKENVPLKIRTATYSNTNYTNYTLSIKIFCDLFGEEKLSNEYEDILIRHISLIVSVFEAEKVISLNVQPEQPQNETVSLSKAVKKTVKNYGLSILDSPKQLKSILDDLCAEKCDVLEFIEFIERMNKGTVDLDNLHEVDNIKKFAKILGDRGYLPLVVILEKLKAREAPQEEENLSKDDHKVRDNADLPEKIHDSDVNAPDENTKDENNASNDENKPVQKQPIRKLPRQKSLKKKLLNAYIACAVFYGLVLVITTVNNQDNASSNYSNTYSGTYNANSSGNTTTSTSTIRTLYVKVDGLNVRSEASADSRIVGVLGQGDRVTTSSPASKKWIYVTGKLYGYVNSDYLSEYPVNNTSDQGSSRKNNENSNDDINENLDLSPKNMKSKE